MHVSPLIAEGKPRKLKVPQSGHTLLPVKIFQITQLYPLVWWVHLKPLAPPKMILTSSADYLYFLEVTASSKLVYTFLIFCTIPILFWNVCKRFSVFKLSAELSSLSQEEICPKYTINPSFASSTLEQSNFYCTFSSVRSWIELL